MSAATQESKPIQWRPAERDVDLEAIAEQVEARRLEEIARQADDQVAANEPATVVEPPHATPEPVVATKVEDQVAKQLRKIKVDGAEVEVSDDDLVASYRHQETTRRAMTAAQQDRAEAARILAEAKTKAIPQEPAPDRAAKVKEYHDALFSGDTETANRLFDEVMTTGRQESPPDAAAIIEQVTPVIKQQLSNESALERFTNDYQDVLGDTNLTLIAQTELRRLEAEGKPYTEALFAAGTHARDWLKSKAPPVETGQPTTTRAEKLDKKAEITQIPSANSKAGSSTERQLTTSEIIAEERKRRGLE